MTNTIARYFTASILAVGALLHMQAQSNKNALAGYVFEDLNKNGVRDNNEPGIKGVAVSDQVNITTTNDQGMYELTNPGGYGIIFISTPDGYAITNNFWQSANAASGPVNFALTKIKTPAAFTFIQASDTHISEKTVDRMDKFRAIIDSVKPSLVIITGDLVKDRQEVTINWRAGQLVMDEPSFNGGKDIGPDPFTTVLSGLVGCTLTTLRMYIKRKGFDITDIHCSVNMLQETEPFKTSIFRTISFGQPVTDEQKEKLLWVAKNCQVARLLQGEIVIDTHLSDDAAVPAGTGNYPPPDTESNLTIENYSS